MTQRSNIRINVGIILIFLLSGSYSLVCWVIKEREYLMNRIMVLVEAYEKQASVCVDLITGFFHGLLYTTFTKLLQFICVKRKIQKMRGKYLSGLLS